MSERRTAEEIAQRINQAARELVTHRLPMKAAERELLAIAADVQELAAPSPAGAGEATEEEARRAVRCLTGREEFFGCDDHDFVPTDGMRRALSDFLARRSPADAGGAWAGITDEEAERVAGVAVQMLADSEPDEDQIDAMDRLKGTPQESMFCVDAPTLTRMITTAIQDAAFDARRAPTGLPTSSDDGPVVGQPCLACGTPLTDDGHGAIGCAPCFNKKWGGTVPPSSAGSEGK